MPEQDEQVQPTAEPEDTPMADSAPESGAESATEAVDVLAAVTKERDDYLDALRRVQADFENYRKRILREQTAHLERAAEGLVEQLLPVLDAFQLAMLNAGSDAEKLRKGVELVYAELLGVLERAGLERIEAEGKPFDPVEHEAVMSVEAEGESGGADPVVVEVMRSGWRLKGRVLRPAMVKVAK
jgi:molecular chaperone GrpE